MKGLVEIAVGAVVIAGTLFLGFQAQKESEKQVDELLKKGYTPSDIVSAFGKNSLIRQAVLNRMTR